MSCKNNLRQHVFTGHISFSPCDANLSADCIRRGGIYRSCKKQEERARSCQNDLRQHVFTRPSPLLPHTEISIYPPPTKIHQRSVYKEHPFEKRTQHIRYDKLHFLLPIPIFIRHFQPMCQESFIPYLH